MSGKRPSSEAPTRRQLLALCGTITTATLAGCGGSGSEETPGGEDDTTDTEASGSNGDVTDTPTESAATTSSEESADLPWEQDDGDSGGSGCPSVPMSYTSREWPDEDPYVSFDIPQVDLVGTEVGIARRLRIQFDEGATVIAVHDTENLGYFDSSVDEVVENEDNPELTDEYDVGSDVHVFAWPEKQELPYNRTLVVLPSGSGSVRVKVTIGVSSTDQGVVCQEALAAAHRRLVESMRTV
ncbi:hypothetical protein [Haloarcula halophila]|uniref:hypothetical protein n=1 Tax=Haloarcula TaxID=2237 RepID=UPI0023E3BBE6|nr:hypothetical protein [Halomicroarcula sp. DFY41]